MVKIITQVSIILVVLLGGAWWYFLTPDLTQTDELYYTTYSQNLGTTTARAQRSFMFPVAANAVATTLTPYPVDQLSAEIDRLVELQGQRSPELREQFERERADFNAVELPGGGTIGTQMAWDDRPLTGELFGLLRSDVEALVAREKLIHNIARPMQLDLRVNSPVDIPQSPSYPSQQAALLQIVTWLITYLDADSGERVAAGVREALNRSQVMGVHTQFDITYGEEIARAYLDELMADNEPVREFLDLIARAEWPTPRHGLTYADAPVSDLVPTVVAPTVRGSSVTFNGRLGNLGPTVDRATTTIVVELDIFADGTIDQTYDFIAPLPGPGGSLPIAHTSRVFRPGDHRYRLLVNQDLGFKELRYFNNVSDWQPVSVVGR